MKTSFAAALLFSITLNLPAQNAGSTFTANPSVPATDQDTPYTILQNDANSRVWERTTYEQAPSGQAIPQKHHYTELATGLNHLVNGEWVESKEEIDILPNGTAQAVQGQHQAYFPGDIYEGQIELVTPDGKHLKSRPLGLSYFDGQNSVLIAQLTNSVGYVIGNNEVIYPNAFTGFKADLRYTYTKAGFEQDVILHEQPPAPEIFGLNPQTTRLQVLTEFFDPSKPSIQSMAMPKQVGVSLTDQNLGFGQMHMIPGRAFLLGHNPKEIAAKVSKSWLLLDGRQFLIEEVPVHAISDGLAALSQTTLNNGGSLRTASRHLILPPRRLAMASTKPMLLSRASNPTQGLVLDYQILNSGLYGFTFQGDTTYYVGGAVDLEYGTVTFEGGTVIKCTNSSSAGILLFAATAVCQTGPYRPAVFTSMDDDSVGEMISGSSHSPVNTGATYLTIDDYGSPDPAVLKYLRFAYAGTALYFEFWQNPCPVRDCQFVNCVWSIIVGPATSTSATIPLALYNDLFSKCSYGVDPSCDVVGANITADQMDNFSDMGEGGRYLTNCIFTAVADIYDVVGILDHCVQASSGSGIYQTIGAGNYYLTNGSPPCRNAGTTNIDPALLAELAQKTTYPPVLYSNFTISVDTTLQPQAQRDFDIPDLGYHYDPIDYLVDSYWVTNATLTVINGAAVACYNDPGLIVTDGSAINSIGTATAPNWFTYYFCVQEQPIALGSNPGVGQCVDSFHSSTAPNGYYRFSKFSCLANRGVLLYHNGNFAYSNLLVQDCEFWNGSEDFTGNNFAAATLKNNLFARSPITSVGSYTNMYLTASNNLFWNMTFALRSSSSSNNLLFFNNSFDNTGIGGPTSQASINGYNAYLVNTNRLRPPAATDIVSTNPIPYQTGPLGYFYQPTNSILINTGSVTADLTGLYHYTTTTNQVKETNSIVDIGYHYVAVNSSGNPIDTDGDGIPDYLEDANGNGLVDSGETDWQNPFDLGLKVLITRPKNNSLIP